MADPLSAWRTRLGDALRAAAEAEPEMDALHAEAAKDVRAVIAKAGPAPTPEQLRKAFEEALGRTLFRRAAIVSRAIETGAVAGGAAAEEGADGGQS